MKILCVKQLNGSLTPCFDSDYNELKKIKAGKEVTVEIKQPRNVGHHKKFFALLNLVFENQERYNNIEHLRRDLTIEAGYYDVRYNLQGVEVYEPKSISFSSMDQAAFNDYYSAVLDIVVKFLGFNKQDIEDNIQQYF